MEIGHLLDRRPTLLSDGERQRVTLGRGTGVACNTATERSGVLGHRLRDLFQSPVVVCTSRR